MKAKTNLFVTLLFVTGLLFGCGGSADDEKQELARQDQRNERDDDQNDRRSRRSSSDDNEPQGLEDAFSQLGSALEEMGEALGGNTKVEPVNFRDLREVLPERLRGLDKGKSSGETTGALGFKVSTVEQIYENEDGDERLEITVVDLGSLKNAAVLGMDWLNMEFDREDDNGFERTTEINGHPALEKCETMGSTERCEVHLIVAERFVVDLESKGLSVRQMRDALDDIDLRKLEKMRNDGVTEKGQ